MCKARVSSRVWWTVLPLEYCRFGSLGAESATVSWKNKEKHEAMTIVPGRPQDADAGFEPACLCKAFAEPRIRPLSQSAIGLVSGKGEKRNSKTDTRKAMSVAIMLVIPRAFPDASIASCERQDLNPRPPAYEAGELPNCSTPRALSLIRTDDLPLTRRLLYH